MIRHPALATLLTVGLLSSTAAFGEEFGNIIINNSSGAEAKLTLRGVPATLVPVSPASSAAHDLTLTAREDGDEGNNPITVGTFSIQRPLGAFQWTYGPTGQARVAMDLADDHSLTLYNPADAASYAIELKPGLQGGVFYNGVALASTASPALGMLTVKGGSLSPNDPGDQPIAWEDRWKFIYPEVGTPPVPSTATAAIGPGARAWGQDAIAIGKNSRAYYQSMAFGENAIAELQSTAIGPYSFARQNGFALGGGANAIGFYSYAFGPQAYSMGQFSIAIGCSLTGGGYFGTAINGRAMADHSLAAGWGTANGESSISLGGYSTGDKSFAADSGTSLGAYRAALVAARWPIGAIKPRSAFTIHFRQASIRPARCP